MENVENHMQENVGWILFNIHNFYILKNIQQRLLNVSLGTLYNVQCGLRCGILLFRCKIS